MCEIRVIKFNLKINYKKTLIIKIHKIILKFNNYQVIVTNEVVKIINKEHIKFKILKMNFKSITKKQNVVSENRKSCGLMDEIFTQKYVNLK